jgi:hypothetical protein
MSIKEDVQAALKSAMKERDKIRLESLRLAKAALLVKEKEAGQAVSDEDAIAVLRSEVRKRQQSIEAFEEVGKTEAAEETRQEIAVFEEFLPKQLSEAQLEEKVRAYLAEHPDVNHAGMLTGALKKELGDAADGKMLNAACRKALG